MELKMLCSFVAFAVKMLRYARLITRLAILIQTPPDLEVFPEIRDWSHAGLNRCKTTQ
jgi:hypothetical protein